MRTEKDYYDQSYNTKTKTDQMDNCKVASRILGALVVGTVVGGALGILFAPGKGSDTRRKISGKYEDLTDSIDDKYNDFLNEIKKDVSIVKDRANELLDMGKNKLKS